MVKKKVEVWTAFASQHILLNCQQAVTMLLAPSPTLEDTISPSLKEANKHFLEP